MALTALLAACAGGGRSGLPSPVVVDPAPIVSGTMRPYEVRGRWYHPEEDARYHEEGLASWYGDQFHGRPTASGERFDMNALTAAHKTLPLPGLVEVTNLETGQSLIVRVNDRGPFVDGRIIDLSRAAADQLGLRGRGVGRVRVRYVGRAPRLGSEQARQYASLSPLPAPRPAPAPGPAIAEAGRFWVQAGSFADPDNARRAAERLGEHARVDVVTVGDSPLYRVLVGPWPDANRAEQARNAVIARGYADALLIGAP